MLNKSNFVDAAGKGNLGRLEELASSYVHQFISNCISSNKKSCHLSDRYVYASRQDSGNSLPEDIDPVLVFELNRYRYGPCNRVENR